MKKITGFKPTPCAGWLLSLCAAMLLNACGSAGESASQQVASALASSTTTLQLEPAMLPDAVAAQVVQPLFHAAPVLLNEPHDADDNAASRPPREQVVSAGFAGISTQRLTAQALRAAPQAMPAEGAATAEGSATPMATSSVVTTFSPAQIRAAYGFLPMPAAGTTLTPAQAAQLGAGQTIYIVDAMHDPNAAAELAAFNQKFGLPACTSKTIATSSSLPLAAASMSGCEFSVVYSTASGTMTSAAPVYDSGWATEIALDVQWAHATAPLARIILIEAPSATIKSLLGAVQLANALGPGIVSMSFGATEGNWTASVDSNFNHSRMTYVAATGDSGASVQWPAVSPFVVAAGGTTLTYSGTGARAEVAWSKTGGGTSLFTPTPSYQTNAVPGMGNMAHRTVADVAFNADPATGQYVAVIAPGSTAARWLSVGGTSLSTPQWAGILAAANALRALAAKPALGAPHAVLYGQIATVPGNYAAEFADITKGSDGSCATCTARVGYDQLTGLGTPNVANLLGNLSGVTVPATAPLVTSASIRGNVGTVLTFTVSVSAPNPVTYALIGAPSGMTISAAGIVTWATPVAGSYTVIVTANDGTTGLTGQGVYPIAIAAPQAPQVGSATISGRPGVALSFTVAVTGSNPVTYSLIGAPSGMTISTSGVVSWPSPVLGTYPVTVIAKDSKTGLSSQGVYTVKIAAAGPVITAPAMNGVAGKPLTGTITLSDTGSSSITVTLSGAPLGMMFSVKGTTIIANWASPATGSYTLKVSAIDSAGLSAQASVPITISAK